LIRTAVESIGEACHGHEWWLAMDIAERCFLAVAASGFVALIVVTTWLELMPY
jgi:hypothetical protein